MFKKDSLLSLLSSLSSLFDVQEIFPSFWNAAIDSCDSPRSVATLSAKLAEAIGLLPVEGGFVEAMKSTHRMVILKFSKKG